LKLARCHRNGDLTAVWVPDAASEALRDLVRQREAAKQDQLRARHRLTKFLLRTGQRPPLGLKAWTERFFRWLAQVRYPQPAQEVTRLDCMNEVEHMSARVKRLEEAILEVVKQAPQAMQEVIRGLQALRGIAHISAVTIAAELGNISSRFEGARNLMGYSGAFPSEDSSGKRIRKGGITKSGNAHLRRIVVESAWCYRHLPRVGEKLRKRHEGLSPEIIEIAWKAQNRLHKRYMKLTMAGKDQRKVITAVGRELLGFIWAIGVKAEKACQQLIAA
jgi:transposase